MQRKRLRGQAGKPFTENAVRARLPDRRPLPDGYAMPPGIWRTNSRSCSVMVITREQNKARQPADAPVSRAPPHPAFTSFDIQHYWAHTASYPFIRSWCQFHRPA